MGLILTPGEQVFFEEMLLILSSVQRSVVALDRHLTGWLNERLLEQSLAQPPAHVRRLQVVPPPAD